MFPAVRSPPPSVARATCEHAATPYEENSPFPPEPSAPLVAELSGTDGPADLSEGEVLALLASAAEADRGELVPLEDVLPA